MSVPGQQRPNPSPLCLLSPPQGVSSLLSFLWQRGLHAVGGSEWGAGAGQVRLINIQDVWHPSSLGELLGASTPAWARMPNLQWGKVEGGSSLSGWTCLPQSWAPRSGWIGSSVSTQKRSSELQVNEKGGVSGNVLFKPQMIELGAPPHWFWGSATCGHLRGGKAGRSVGRRAPSARARRQSWGRRALAESPPAPGQPLPRCRSPAGPTPSPAAPSGRRGPARPSRAPALICCGRGGATASSGAVPERGREGKGEKCSAPEARSALLVRPRGRRRTSLERSAHGERVVGRRRRRRGGGQKESEEAGEVRASEPSGGPGRPAGQGRALPPVGERASRPSREPPPQRERVGGCSHDSLKLCRPR